VRVEIEDGKHGMQRMNQESNVPRRFDGMYVFHLCAQIQVYEIRNKRSHEMSLVDETSITILMKLGM
jgi:hypothetical protein